MIRKNISKRNETQVPSSARLQPELKLKPEHRSIRRLRKNTLEPSSIQPDKSEYNDLSIEYTNNELSPEKTLSRMESQEILKHARQSLIDLQLEAKNCMDTSKRLQKENDKKFRSSIIKPYPSFTSPSISTQELLIELTKNIENLNKRLIMSEQAMVSHAEENTTLKIEIESLHEKLKDNSKCELDTNSRTIGCKMDCLIM